MSFFFKMIIALQYTQYRTHKGIQSNLTEQNSLYKIQIMNDIPILWLIECINYELTQFLLFIVYLNKIGVIILKAEIQICGIAFMFYELNNDNITFYCEIKISYKSLFYYSPFLFKYKCLYVLEFEYVTHSYEWTSIFISSEQIFR